MKQNNLGLCVMSPSVHNISLASDTCLGKGHKDGGQFGMQKDKPKLSNGKSKV